jgi:tetratricopeptide (TPR) repeat protein
MRANKVFLIAVISLCAFAASAQIDFTKYFDESSVPLIDPGDHLDLVFKWDMPGNVQVHLNEGINYLKEGDPKLAVSNFDEVLKLDSLSWVAYYYRGVAKKNLFQFSDAKKDLLASRKLNGKQGPTYVELGEIYQLENSFNKASDEYESALALDPTLVQAHYNLGSIALTKGDVRRALKNYQKCNEINPKYAQAYMMQGLIKFLARKKDGESIALFDKALQADSSYSLTYFWKGLANISLEKPQECLKNWDTLIRLQPENALYLILRGCLYIELGDFDNAFNDLRKAMKQREVDDERFTAGQTVLDKRIDLQYAANYLISTGYGLDEKAFGFLKKGFCLLIAGKYKASVEEIKNAEKIQPSATVFFLAGLAYEHSGEHPTAFKYYNTALTLDNDIFDAHKKRAIYRMELKDYKNAYKDIDEMFRLQPKSPVAYRLRGLARSNDGNYKGAIADLDQFIKTDSTDYEAIRTRSACHMLFGDEKSANEDLRLLLHLDENWELYETVATNYIILKDTANAIEIWKEFAALKPEVFIPFMELARLYIQQEKWDSAKAEIDKLLPIINPDQMPKKYAEILYWQGLIKFHQSLYEEAIGNFTKALKNDATYLDAKYFRAKAYEKSGQLKKAQNDYKELKNVQYKDAKLLFEAIAGKT